MSCARFYTLEKSRLFPDHHWSSEYKKRGNVITCSEFAICIGTSSDDIIYSGSTEQVYGVGGNDIIFGNTQDQLYGGTGDDLITTGTGSNLADGGPAEKRSISSPW